MAHVYHYNRQQQQPYMASNDTTRQNSYDPYSAGNSHARLDSITGADLSGGYRDDPNKQGDVREKGHMRDSSGSHFSPVSTKFGSRNKESFKSWRSQHYESGYWTKGGALGCIGRFCCCGILITLLLIISIVLTIALYIRPPDVEIGAVALDTDASTGAIERNSTSITIHLKVPLTVNNPNFFDAAFTKVTTTAFYPINGNQFPIGGGEKSNIVFKSRNESTVNFPLSFQYTSSKDPNGVVIMDIAQRCGVLGGAKQDLPINYSIKVDLKIVVPTISPTFSGSAKFGCPLSASDLTVLAGSLLGGQS